MSRSDFALLNATSDVPAAFTELFDRHFASVYRFAARRVGRDNAEDLCVEVFLVAFRQRADYVPLRSSALPWLYGIATRLIAKQRRSEQRYLRSVRRLPVDAESFPIDELVEQADASQAWPEIASALARLSAKERDALLLLVWGGLGYDDIASLLGVPIGTVKSRINKARVRLRKDLTRWNPSTT